MLKKLFSEAIYMTEFNLHVSATDTVVIGEDGLYSVVGTVEAAGKGLDAIGGVGIVAKGTVW